MVLHADYTEEKTMPKNYHNYFLIFLILKKKLMLQIEKIIELYYEELLKDKSN